MFQFFTKKRFFIDLLDGFVDMHNHILPGIDDGAKNVEESIALIKGFAEFGVTSFIATPHIMDNYYPNTPSTINEALSNLKKGLEKETFNEIEISAAAEHMIDSNFETLLENGSVMPMKQNYLLVEMSYLQSSINFSSSIKKIAAHRFFPILAHPERYVFLHGKLKKHKKYKKKGMLYQMNMLSLSEFYGKEVQKVAYKLLDENLFDFIGSDVHNQQQLQYLKEMKISKKYQSMISALIDKTTYNFQ